MGRHCAASGWMPLLGAPRGAAALLPHSCWLPPGCSLPFVRGSALCLGGSQCGWSSCLYGGVRGGAPRPVEMLPSSRCHKTSESRKQLRLLDVNEVCGVLV